MLRIQHRLAGLFLIAIIGYTPVHAQSGTGLLPEPLTLSNGWKLSPAGKQLKLGDLPLNMCISPSGEWMVVTNNGQSDQSLQLIDLEQQQVVDSIKMAKSWYGLVMSKDNKTLYASGGNDNWILRYEIKDRRIVPKDTFKIGNPWPVKISPAGMALDEHHQQLYVVTKENNSLYVLDLKTKIFSRAYPLGGEGYTCLLSPDANTLYISCWGCDRVLLFNTQRQAIEDSIAVGDNPNALCLTKNGHLLYVANANDNTVSVINTKTKKVIETLNAALFPEAPMGSTTNGLALSGDEKTLYVANADNNCLAVFEVEEGEESKSKGFIPTGWYPTCVLTHKKKIYVANGKGLSSKANPHGPNPNRHGSTVTYQQGNVTRSIKEEYIGGLLKGALSIIEAPTPEEQSQYTAAVYANSPLQGTAETEKEWEPNNPIPRRIGDPSPIKYVFYIIKENRTYDQVFGDLPEGNGDSTLVLFGEKVTPNQHALVKEFVLMDNFYVEGEVSADGHNWSLGAYATDYLEKNWPTSYGDRGGTYDAEGTRKIANNKNGFIWDQCQRNNVSYRTYGEFADDYKPNLPVIEGHFCPYYTSWDQTVRDTTRYHQWSQEFDSLVAVNNLPRLNTLRFINDHTEGLSKGRPSPKSHVADNDLAVGMFIEHLSHSPVWKESAVFIVEDDAQNGPDHVDAHRTTAYVAGGFVKTGYVDHTMYSTTSMLRTMELILGIPPMSQYDASSVPMWHCFSTSADHQPFVHRPNRTSLSELNLTMNKWSKMSEGFDFGKEDRVPDRLLNEVIWAGVKGDKTPCPAPVHAAFFTPNATEDKD